jgi:hypothetical protein
MTTINNIATLADARLWDASNEKWIFCERVIEDADLPATDGNVRCLELEYDRLLLVELVAEYNRLLEAVEVGAPDADDALDLFLERHPGVPSYDNRGNYVGSVSNENGWTA